MKSFHVTQNIIFIRVVGALTDGTQARIRVIARRINNTCMSDYYLESPRGFSTSVLVCRFTSSNSAGVGSSIPSSTVCDGRRGDSLPTCSNDSVYSIISGLQWDVLPRHTYVTTHRQ